MIVKKLAAPLINEKILVEAEHCYMATASISEAAFDFIKSRLHPKCKIDIVTGLDVATSPNVLKRVLRHYHDRITFHIYTKNFFHPNVYIFDLPYRKSVAFVGSGHFTLEGLKDNEEIFYKIKDPKEIETLKSWFTGYYEFAEPLTEAMAVEYALIYPSLKRYEIESRQERNQFIALTMGGFQWDTINFKNQYFKKEDYLLLGNSVASSQTPELHARRVALQDKIMALHQSVLNEVPKLNLFKHLKNAPVGCSVDPLQSADKKIRAIWITYTLGNDVGELNDRTSYYGMLSSTQLRIAIMPKEISITLLPGENIRKNFVDQFNEASYRNTFFQFLITLKKENGMNDHWFEVAGDKRMIGTFQNEDSLLDFIKSDSEFHYSFSIGKSFFPGSPEINISNIVPTMQKELEKLILLYEAMQMN